MEKQQSGYKMTGGNNICIGIKAGMLLTNQSNVIIIGDNIEIAKSGEMLIGDTLNGVPIPDELKKALRETGRENAYHIIYQLMFILNNRGI